MKIRFYLFLIPILTLGSCTMQKQEQKPENLIIFIGDGMGVAQVYAGMTASGFTMTFPSFPFTGFSITNSLDSYITDSAAGATALSTGEKTNNGMIAMRPDSTILETIMEIAKKKGLSTGVISTSAITHATPAGFIAHDLSRGSYEDIAKDYLKGGADVFIGGGKANFTNRKDSLDLTLDLKKAGYDVVYTLDELNKSTSNRIAGLMADFHMPFIAEGRDTSYLADATSKAIEVLSKNPKGFVLMVEGSMIDFAGHSNDAPKIIDETLDMDRAVKRAFNFARQNEKTLIVVTADHETGGLTLIDGNVKGKSSVAAFSGEGHTAVMVPVFAFGPGAVNFTGVHQNTALFDNFVKLLSLK